MPQDSRRDIHVRHGAVFHEDHPDVPRHYGSPEAEYRALREGTACIDASGCGRIRLTGKQVLDFLQRLSTNDVKNLPEGHWTRTVLTTEKGRMIDWVSLYRLSDHFLMVTAPRNSARVSQWLDKYLIMDDVKLEDRSEQTFLIELTGPQSPGLLKDLSGISLERDPDDRIVGWDWQGLPLLVARSDLLEQPGFRILGNAEDYAEVVNRLAGRTVFCGADACEVARIEDAKPKTHHEVTDQFNPLEAGLGPWVSFTKGCYIGQEVIARLDSYQKVQRHLVKFRLNEQPEPKSRIFLEDRDIGVITSSTYSLREKTILALGYVKTEFVTEKKKLTARGEKKICDAWIIPSGA